ncbi:hypothetical protein TRIADDRAFT_62830 [Trichoplax adhaerens]|uniref:Uncharacterized protein n=1 Tax=Trichoplax adhaerens TaxID=10228 RepID=B3SF07_TRIAD|nr:hypothetical protein TRIADDRAFT_62830 [Trichoplax adhaerens]EDV18688.1 hypothetical protein TRIADDRAFT_62830 [Trichoplax adhaerens]|eukprot:XP_002118826.1 hypothetical protein TRIADDRAFT_62830 [Trichoplax adhaerens]
MEIMWLKTNNKIYLSLYKFWVKIFALAFGMGVVTGIPMSFQFGTNFGKFSELAGSVIGPLIGVEVMTAFFLEAAFIGVMIFGWKRFSAKVHLIATILVVLGTHHSAFWILSLNSWMHTPDGISVIDGSIRIHDWLKIDSYDFSLLHYCFFIFGRGLAFEFRLKAMKSRWIWDWSFIVGSYLATFSQGISLWPYIVVPDITIWDSAAPPETLKFVSIIICISLPIVIGYSIFVYYLFKEKLLLKDNIMKRKKALEILSFTMKK